MIGKKGYKVIAILSTVSFFCGISPVATYAAPEVVASSATDAAESVQEADEAQPDQEAEEVHTLPEDEKAQTSQEDESVQTEAAAEVVKAESENAKEGEQEPAPVEDEDEEVISDQLDQAEILEEIEQGDKKEVTCGFEVDTYSLTDTFKYKQCSSRNADGTNTYVVCFSCSADETWIDENIQFEIKDVTSNGIISVMKDAGIAYSAPVSSVSSVTNGKVITVNAGMSTRYLKITAFLEGEPVDEVYLISNGRMSDNKTYSSQDQKLFEDACAAVEAKIWNVSMSNLEKLQAFADYICSVSHYPGSDTTKAEYNPTWASRWSVDGSTDSNLIWHNFEDKYVDWTMALEGGESTSQAVDILYYVARNHLGLQDIDGSQTGNAEGICVASGSQSSNPTNREHYSLIYEAKDGSRTYVDAQGLSYSASSDHVTCSSHGCQSLIIPISRYCADGTEINDNEDDEFEWEGAEEEMEIDFQIETAENAYDAYLDYAQEESDYQEGTEFDTDIFYWGEDTDEMDFRFDTVDDTGSFFWDVAADEVDFLADTFDDTGIYFWDGGEDDADFLIDFADDGTYISDDVDGLDEFCEVDEENSITVQDSDSDNDKKHIGFLKNFPKTGEGQTLLPYMIVILSAGGAIAFLFIRRRRRGTYI